ncbi:hypothetical protein ACWEO1_27560 [Kitasatospora cineracea]
MVLVPAAATADIADARQTPPPSAPDGALTSVPGPAAAVCRNRQHQAERELRNLSTRVINDTAAPAQLDGFTSHDAEPVGALVFAALLYLSGHPRNAQFWFEFAAGAGDGTAAFSLYLHHAAAGELREAEHWLRQTAHLSNQSGTDVPLPAIPPVDTYLFNAEWHGQHVPDDTGDLPRPDPQLRETVAHLQDIRAGQLGPFVLPTPEVAEQLHDLVCQ